MHHHIKILRLLHFVRNDNILLYEDFSQGHRIKSPAVEIPPGFSLPRFGLGTLP